MEDVAAATIRQMIREQRDRFRGLSAVERYLGEVEGDLIAHAEEFRGLDEKPALPFLPAPGAFLDRYRVNVLVDSAGAHGAPVVLEENPTHRNLLGRIEHRVHLGTLVTDFTLIKAGALHRANGGYLILEAMDVLRNLFAWEALKKALKSRAVRIEEPLQVLTAFSAGTCAGPIRCRSGRPPRQPLSLLSPLRAGRGLRRAFKVRWTSALAPAHPQARGSTPASSDLPAERRRPLRAGSASSSSTPRLASDRGRLVPMGDLLDLVRESAFWAGEPAHAWWA